MNEAAAFYIFHLKELIFILVQMFMARLLFFFPSMKKDLDGFLVGEKENACRFSVHMFVRHIKIHCISVHDALLNIPSKVLHVQ